MNGVCPVTFHFVTNLATNPSRPAYRAPWCRRLLVSAAALAGAVAFLAPTPAGATHSWEKYHWARTANPFTLQLADNLTSVWEPYLTDTSTDWTTSEVLDTKIVPGVANPKTCRATAGRVEVCNAKYGVTGWVGLGSIWISGGHITQGTAKLNDTYYNTARYNTPAWRNTVMCQEVGHTFGLAHQDENQANPNLGSCMDYSNVPAGGVVNGIDYGPSNENVGAHDFGQLVSDYEHLDATSTVSATNTAGTRNGESGNSRADWGRAVAKDANGRDNQFVRDLGNGEQVVTFVTWSD